MIQLPANWGGPLPPTASPSAPRSWPKPLTTGLGRGDAVDRRDLGRPATASIRPRAASASMPRLGGAADDDVGAGVDLGEEVVEVGPQGVAEHERAGEEGDAEDDGDGRADQAAAVGPQLLEGERQHGSTSRVSLDAVEDGRRRRVVQVVDDPAVGEEHAWSAYEAATGSWVTITMVWPSSSTARRRKPRISAPLRESRLPVGSSAKTMSGRLASARATATRCCWPPESSAGRWLSRSPRPTVSMTSSSQRRRAGAGEGQRQGDVLAGGERRHQVERLEHEADCGRGAAA